MPERPRKRDQRRERHATPRSREEAEAEGVRNRVERVLDEDEEGDEAPRVSHAPWRLATMGLPLLALALIMGKRVIDVLDYGGLEEYVPPITDDQKKERQAIAEAAKKEGLQAIFDEPTSNVIFGRAAKRIKESLFDEPLVTFTMDGQTIIARRNCALKILEANRKMQKELGHGIEVLDSFRSNKSQEGARERSYGKGIEGAIRRKLKWQKSAAAKPGYGFHEIGCAFDVKNWQKAEPYLEAEGFVGGRDNGIKDDPAHFDMGRILPKQPKKLKKESLKKH